MDVIVPKDPPYRRSLRLPKKGATYNYLDVKEYVSRKRCALNILTPDSWRGRGDVDFLAMSSDIIVLLEVKTRLVARTVVRKGPDWTRLFLQYHLDEPFNAMNAWSRILTEQAWEVLDRPSSISELMKAGVAVAIGLVNSKVNIDEKKFIIGAALPFYAVDFIGAVDEYVYRTSENLSQCLGFNVYHVVYVVFVDKVGRPGHAVIKCLSGNGCGLAPRELRIKLRIPLEYLGCDECQYKKYCAGKFSSFSRS